MYTVQIDHVRRLVFLFAVDVVLGFILFVCTEPEMKCEDEARQGFGLVMYCSSVPPWLLVNGSNHLQAFETS